MNKTIAAQLFLLAGLGLAACGEDNADAPQQQSQQNAPQESQPAPEPEKPVMPDPAASAVEQPKAVETAGGEPDLKRGERQFKKCRSCHTLAEGEKHKTGPNLWGIFGAEIASREDFKYSNALSKLDGQWTEEEMDKFIKRPSAYAPGSIMSFAGIARDRDRRDLIAYMKQETMPDN